MSDITLTSEDVNANLTDKQLRKRKFMVQKKNKKA